MSSAPTPLQSPLPANDPAVKLRHFPEHVRASFRQFQATGDEAAMTVVIFAILKDFTPVKPEGDPVWPDSAVLIDDLGFDSLAIAETIFFIEDLFGISVTNEEILTVRTVGELRSFIKNKMSPREA